MGKAQALENEEVVARNGGKTRKLEANARKHGIRVKRGKNASTKLRMIAIG